MEEEEEEKCLFMFKASLYIAIGALVYKKWRH
jgi:hypothetical protein